MDLSCHVCGKRFRSAIAEARHRHNWPVLCTRNKRFAKFMAEHYPPKEKTP
jgi:hypothetical protein